MGFHVREVRAGDREDAERLAEMFADFDSAWPGGFTRGARPSVDSVLDYGISLPVLSRFVADENGTFLAYCDIEAQPGQNELAYIGLLGARLSSHGRGAGKAVLRAAIDLACERGYRIVALDTWAGNIKAVPLYKRTGFNWTPDTSVLMKNYVPSLLAIPAVQRVLAGRDWYECVIREVDQDPDDVTWRGMKVYPYVFRNAGRTVTVRFDARSDRPTSIEADDLAVYCSIPVKQVVAGERCPIEWEIVNGTGRPLSVEVRCAADPGLDLSLNKTISVIDRVAVTREIDVAADLRPRGDDEFCYRVRTHVRIDGEPFELETGVKVVRPVEIGFGGASLWPGRVSTITVPVKSNLVRTLSGNVTLNAEDGLTVAERVRPLVLEANGSLEVEFEVVANRPGCHQALLVFEADDVSVERRIAFRALGSAPVASIDDDGEIATVESPTLKVAIGLRDGKISVYRSGGSAEAVRQRLPAIGPPFDCEFDYRPALLTCCIVASEYGDVLTTTFHSKRLPGIELERTVAIVAGEVVRVDVTVRNVCDSPVSTRVQLRNGTEFETYVSYPAVRCLIREPRTSGATFPQGDEDLLAHGERLAESWAAAEQDGLVGGVVWQSGADEHTRWSRLPHQIHDITDLRPGESVNLPPTYLIAAPGDWKQVRGWWERLARPSNPPAADRDRADERPRSVVEVRASPPIVLFGHVPVEFELEVSTVGCRIVNGTLSVASNVGAVGPLRVPIKGVARDRPMRVPITWSFTPKQCAGRLTATLDTGPDRREFDIPFVRIANEGAVNVSASTGDLLRVENGCLSFEVAPSFAGSIIRLESGGVNHVLSAYPERRAFAWDHPWTGGIRPTIEGPGEDLLVRSSFEGTVIEREGERGFKWRGVQVALDLTREELSEVHVEVEYLTLPGSRLIAVITRWINRGGSTVSMPGEAGIEAWLQVGGSRSDSVLHWERESLRGRVARGGFGRRGSADRWAAVESSRTGQSIVLVATEGNISLRDLGDEGPHLASTGSVKLKPSETKEILTWIVLADSADELNGWRALSAIGKLP